MSIRRGKVMICGNSLVIAALLAFGTLMLCSREASALTGNDWNQLSEPARFWYVAGVVDAWADAVTIARAVDGERTIFHSVVDCLRSRTMHYSQIMAIVVKYMKDNPNKWTYTMASTIFVAMDEACK